MRRPDSAGGAHGWAQGWAGLGRGARLRGTRFGSSSLSARAPALAAASAAASTSPLRLRRRAPARAGALNAAQGLPAKPGPDCTLPPHPPPPPRATSAPLPPPSASLPTQLWPLGRRRLSGRSRSHAPLAPRALTRSAKPQLSSAPGLHLFSRNFTKNKRTSPVL